MTDGWVFVVPFIVAAVLGLRGSIRLTLRFRDVRTRLDAHEALILFAIVVVAWVVTVAAFYFGGLAVRRLLGFDTIPELVPVSALISIVVLFIPTLLDAVVDRVARVPWK